MTEPGATRTHGRPIDAVIALAWVGLGLWRLEDGNAWLGAALVALGLLTGSTYFWPDSPVGRFLSAPVFGRKRPTDR